MSDDVARVKLELETKISEQMEKVSRDLEKRFGEIQKNTQAVAQGFAGANQSFGKLVAGMAGGSLIAGAISKIKDSALGLVGALIKSNSQLEQSKVAFGVMLGSAEKADELLRKLYKFAAETPFETEELMKASKALLAFGSTAESIPEELKAIGDISSAIGAPIGEIAELYGKARVQGRLFAQDVNQLVGRGIPVIQEFAKQLGVTDSAVKKMVEEGRISFDNLETAFRDLTSEGGRFKGMMEAQSKTFAGMYSTLKDNLSQAMIAVGSGGVFDVLTQNLKRANEWINANQTAINNFSKAVGARLGQAIQFVVDHTDELVTVGKILLGVFAVQKLVGIATAIRGIGLALAGLTATNPILLSIGLVLGTASLAYSQAKDASQAFNQEAANIKEGEKQLAQYNSTLQKVTALHKKAMEGPNPFGGIKAPSGQVDPNTLSPAARASYDRLAASAPKQAPGKPAKANGLGLSEEELKKQAKALQTTQDQLKDAQIQSIGEGYDRDLAALAEKHSREQRELAGNSKALIALQEAHRVEKANLDQKYDDLEFEANAKANEAKRESNYQIYANERKAKSDLAREEERQVARQREIDELKREQAFATVGNLIAAGQTLVTHNRKNAFLLKSLAIGEILVNTARGMAASWSAGPYGIPLALSIGALGAAQVAKVASQEFEDGGPIIGPRHRYGGVPINAEGGEFMLSRTDVSNLGGYSGVERLRKGGGMGNQFSFTPTIIINGNADEKVVTQALVQYDHQFRKMWAQAERDQRYDPVRV